MKMGKCTAGPESCVVTTVRDRKQKTGAKFCLAGLTRKMTRPYKERPLGFAALQLIFTTWDLPSKY